MGVTLCILVEFEEFFQISKTEMALNIFFVVNNTAAQGFLVGLPLEYLLLYCTSLRKKKKLLIMAVLG